MPVTAYAETYRMNGTDLSIQVDDTIWYVFTRDNLENNPELEELGVSYDAIHSIFYDNDAYMDAVLYYGDEGYIEFFIRKTPQTSGLVNLSNYSQEDVTKFAAAFAEQHNIQEYSVYENQYKFAKMEYFDSNAEMYLCEFITVVNKENYTFTFQSTFEFGDFEHEQIDTIIDSIVFDVDTTLKEPKNSSMGESVLKNTLIGAISGGIAGGLIALFNKKKKKSKDTADCGPEIN